MTIPASLASGLSERYEIIRELGAGGMATVYLARDVKHDRRVALKVLKPELGAVLGAERFLTEIRVTANLQHPHLLPLFDSGETSGLLFYVMPFVEGESLRHRMDREQQLPLADAVRIATAVASALTYAHEHGIIHRDLKPENILLQAGHPVVADFGIALAVSNAGGARITQTGLSLGTPSYMSPEQASGDRNIDARSDIYSLAAMTYEMLAGEPPHTGPNAQAVIAKLMTTEPAPVTDLRKSVPRNIAAALAIALSKTPADRFVSAKEFADALNDPGFGAVAPGANVGHGGTSVLRWQIAAGVFALAAIGAFAFALRRGAASADDRGVTRFAFTIDTTASWTSSAFNRVAISPDGSMIAIASSTGGPLMLRRRDEVEARPLPGTNGAVAPFFSPDGAQVGYSVGKAIKISPTAGGAAMAGPSGVDGRFGAAWGDDGYIYGPALGSLPGIVRVSTKLGSGVEQVTTVDSAAGETLHRFPQPLPNGKGLVFTILYMGSKGVKYTIGAADLEAKTHRVLVPTGAQPQYDRGGYLVYDRGPDLMAIPFDEKSLKSTGDPVRVANGVRLSNLNLAEFAAANGLLAYVAAEEKTNLQLAWVSRDGRSQPVDPAWTGEFVAPSLSPDGARLAIGLRSEAVVEVWVKQLDRGPVIRLGQQGVWGNGPSWTADGRSVTFQAHVDGSYVIATQRADGGAAPIIGARARSLAEAAWSPDGKTLLVRSSLAGVGEGDILLAHPPADTAPTPLIASTATEKNMSFSPDGKWLAYTSNESGQFEVYVVPFPDVKVSRSIVSTSGGDEPRWSHHGNEIFFRDAAGNMVAAEVRTSPTFSVLRSTVLFNARSYKASNAYRNYDVSPDDKRFVMIQAPSTGAGLKLIVVENWRKALAATKSATR